MSNSPFRSEVEQLRERLRRMEDQKRELEDLVRVREEKLRKKHPRRGVWAAATFGIAVAAWAFGGLLASADAKHRHNQSEAIARAGFDQELAMCKSENTKQAIELKRAQWDLTMCKTLPPTPRATVTSEPVTPPPRPADTSSGRPTTTCKCAPNDPLCSCL